MRGVGIMALSASRREVRFGGPSVWQFFFSLKKEHRRVATAQITLIFSFNLKLGENPLGKGSGIRRGLDRFLVSPSLQRIYYYPRQSLNEVNLCVNWAV